MNEVCYTSLSLFVFLSFSFSLSLSLSYHHSMLIHCAPSRCWWHTYHLSLSLSISRSLTLIHFDSHTHTQQVHYDAPRLFVAPAARPPFLSVVSSLSLSLSHGLSPTLTHTHIHNRRITTHPASLRRWRHSRVRWTGSRC